MSTYSLSSYDKNLPLCNDPAFVDFMEFWINKHITSPIQGFEQKTKEGGEKMTHRELLAKTHDQILHAASYFYNRGKPLHEILDILSSFKK